MENIFKYLLLILLLANFSSCTADIDPAAANSGAAILAVIGEYILAILSFVLFYCVKLLRPLGIAACFLFLGNEYLNWATILPSKSLLFIGLALIGVSMIPLPLYKPHISIHKQRITTKAERPKISWVNEIVIPIAIGLILLLIEHFIIVPMTQ